MDHRLPATLELAREFSELFVNRRAYTIQSRRPHPEAGVIITTVRKPRTAANPRDSASKSFGSIWRANSRSGSTPSTPRRNAANGWRSMPTTRQRSKT